MRKNLIFAAISLALHNTDESVQNSAETPASETSVVAVKVSFNAKYEKDAKGNTVTTTVTDKDGKKTEEKVVKTPAKTVTANLNAPKFSELTPDILSSLYNTRLEKLANQYVKGEAEESLVNGAEFTYTISPADLLGETQEISEELEETAKTAFMQYLATQGKTEKAQKNNALLLGASVTTLSTRDQRIISAYESNLTKFIETSNADLIVEIEPVLTRANRRLERSKNSDIGNLI